MVVKEESERCVGLVEGNGAEVVQRGDFGEFRLQGGKGSLCFAFVCVCIYWYRLGLTGSCYFGKVLNAF